MLCLNAKGKDTSVLKRFSLAVYFDQGMGAAQGVLLSKSSSLPFSPHFDAKGGKGSKIGYKIGQDPYARFGPRILKIGPFFTYF